ncbi:hypothetical protein A5643_16700 [Mycobacterium sp. 1274756.6]|nr:hypothetical protein A5643_16700 [Mycobacterium sp. 1274756.6]
MLLAAGTVGCADTAAVADLRVGDCVNLGGTADRPHAVAVECGSPESNFKVVAKIPATPAAGEACPVDVDSTFSMRDAFNRAGGTACLDIDWVLGGCMSVDPASNADPVRVDCHDASVRPRQRATEILTAEAGAIGADQCGTGLGYTYTERRFTVCVENLG